jgi:hypothetical protein
MMSERLEYRPVTAATLDDFHRLVEDDHVRRYLMDGERLPREWSEQRVRDSTGLFERRGVGLWLAHQRETGDVVGFCGFLDLPSMHPQPQLVYAMFERCTGQGYATRWRARRSRRLAGIPVSARLSRALTRRTSHRSASWRSSGSDERRGSRAPSAMRSSACSTPRASINTEEGYPRQIRRVGCLLARL